MFNVLDTLQEQLSIRQQKTIATVVEVDKNSGMSKVELITGEFLQVIGTSVDIGKRVIIENGKIVSEAPIVFYAEIYV